MFWKVSSFSSGSAIEGILDKQQVTLEELLEEDEMVQVAAKLSASSQCLSWVQIPVLTCVHIVVPDMLKSGSCPNDSICTLHQHAICTACEWLMQIWPSG
jgi:hypothetical protein